MMNCLAPSGGLEQWFLKADAAAAHTSKCCCIATWLPRWMHALLASKQVFWPGIDECDLLNMGGREVYGLDRRGVPTAVDAASCW